MKAEKYRIEGLASPKQQVLDCIDELRLTEECEIEQLVAWSQRNHAQFKGLQIVSINQALAGALDLIRGAQFQTASIKEATCAVASVPPVGIGDALHMLREDVTGLINSVEECREAILNHLSPLMIPASEADAKFLTAKRGKLGPCSALTGEMVACADQLAETRAVVDSLRMEVVTRLRP